LEGIKEGWEKLRGGMKSEEMIASNYGSKERSKMERLWKTIEKGYHTKKENTGKSGQEVRCSSRFVKVRDSVIYWENLHYGGSKKR